MAEEVKEEEILEEEIKEEKKSPLGRLRDAIVPDHDEQLAIVLSLIHI